MADLNKPAVASPLEPQIKPANPFRAVFPVIAIAACAAIAYIIFYLGCGNPVNFENGPAAKEAYDAWVAGGQQGEEPPHPTKGHPVNTWGLIFKGGFVIPIGFTLALTLFTFVIERAITISRASGRGNTDVFVKSVRNKLAQGDVNGAAQLCDKQHGSVGNVIKAGLRKYAEMAQAHDLEKDVRKSAIQAELEEATMLELPMLERNLPIIATTASLGTLVGLIGTVLGMIRAFSALGEGGAPNAAELSVGISEALINTALGITTSALSILFYNFFTTRIDGMTYAMDEAGYSVVQTFDQRNN